MNLENTIESAFKNSETITPESLDSALSELMAGMNSGIYRAAKPSQRGWQVCPWVKKGILLLFRRGVVTNMSPDNGFAFFDKHTLPLKSFSPATPTRIVPGGTSIRNGAYLSDGVIIMPPAYVNIGAYIDEGTLVDSHVLVGSCAQIGKNVHLSAGVQIGGVLEPVGSLPVIIEDDVVIGGNCGVFEGTTVSKNAVIAAGVQLTRSVPVYDCIHETILRSTADHPLVIPPNAVVVPGTRPLISEFGKANQLSISTPLIIKYRDEKTHLSTLFEESLR